MKLLTFICLSIFFVSLFFAIKNEMTETKDNQKEITRDCAEFGLCKEGLTIFWNDKETTITKDFCLKNNYKWHEKKSFCFVR